MAEKATIDDVASRCGFSRATVSRVLNHEGSVKPSTAVKVEDAMRDLGYIPNSMARALSGGGTRTIALLLPDVVREYYASLLAGADAAAEEKGYHLLLKTGSGRKAMLDLLDQARVDAFIIRNAGEPVVDRGVLSRLKKLGFPYLFIGEPLERSELPAILIDNVGGARAMAHHYAGHGFRRILFIAGPQGSIDSNDRIYGFKLGLSEEGIDPAGVRFAEGDFSREAGYRAAREHLRSEAAEAVFAANDRMALGVLNYCHEQGIRVPEDLAVTGFDDTFFAEHLWPPLSTVQQPMYEIGATAVENLILWLEGSRSREPRIILPTRLKIRRSCGCNEIPAGSQGPAFESKTE